MPASKAKSLLLVILGLSFWAAFHGMAPAYNGYDLELGSVQFPARQFARFGVLFSLLGSMGAVCVAVGLTGLFPKGKAREARWFVPIATLVGMLVPALIRFAVLQGGAITDDESAYRFSAELLASGRLTVESHPLRLFFDHAFIINDGRMYSQYFLGWPALMALSLPFGGAGYLNAIISGATVPGLYKLAEAFVGARWARLAVLLFLTAPMIQIAAATQMSHTLTLGLLVYAVLFGTMTERGSRPWVHAAFGLFLAMAFFVRPLSVVGVALPWGLLWLWRQVRGPRSWRNLLAFAVPVVALGAIFLWFNAELTGSPFKTAYQRAFEYATQNDFRFTHVGEHRAGQRVLATSGGLPEIIAIVSHALVRLNWSLFGWPASLLLLPFAIGARRSALWWASIGTYIVSHSWLHDPGVDSFGPTHWFEMALPVIMLTTLGCERATGWARAISGDFARFPAYLVASLIACSLLLFSPYRLQAVAEIGEMTTRPLRAIEDAGIENAVVFSDRPWAMRCVRHGVAPHHFVAWWPVNDPDFSNPVLWANHLSISQDRRLLDSFPGRTGYLASWNASSCKMSLIPMDEASEERTPNGFMRMKNGQRVLYTNDISPTGRAD